ncbi:MAG: BamA/TamA family outer membrane protein [Nitrospirae bacterium]|nr:BamA/TamA family outer membrane protein [Candidatus Manganitrophaceae bacterium]
MTVSMGLPRNVIIEEMILLLPLFLLFGFSSAWAASPEYQPEYQIVAAYSETTQRIYGSETIHFTNESPVPLSEIYLFLYPNLYLEKDPRAEITAFQQTYPVGFNTGEMEVTAIQDAHGDSLSSFPELFKNNMLMRVPLPRPIGPGESFDVIVHFTTVIPEKYGVFGQYRNLVTLQGGWYPYLAARRDDQWNFLLPPAPSGWKIYFTLPSDRDLIASVPWKGVYETGAWRTFLFEADRLPYFSLSIGLRPVQKEKTIGPVVLTYHFRSEDRIYAKGVLRTVDEATSFFLRTAGPLPPTQLQLTESHLYQDLATPGAGILFLSTKLFKTFPLLKRFHRMRIARGLFILLWREKLPQEEAWVIEGLGSLETQRFFQDKYGPRPTLATWLTPLGFIPFIDDILYSKDLPLRQVYFSESSAHTVNEDIQFFNASQADGATIFDRIRNLVGEQKVEEAVAAYLQEVAAGGTPTFRRILYRLSGTNLDPLIDQWLSASPALDFGLSKISKKKVEEGYLTSILVEKKGIGVEPIEILAEEKNGTQIPLFWTGEENSYEGLLITPSPITSVEIDPSHQSSDTNPLNNRYPNRWKVLVTDFPTPDYNVNTRTFTYSGELLFQRMYDDQNGITVDYSHSDIGEAGGVFLSHVLKRYQTGTFGVVYQAPETPIDSPPQKPAGTLHLGYALNVPEIPLAGFVQRLTGRYPKSNLTLGFDQRFTGGLYQSLFAGSIDLRRSYALSNYHEIVGRFFWGESVGSLFKKSRFFLGGEDAMRGFVPLRFEGSNMTLVSIEYRFPLYYETDVNMMGLMLTHTLQNVLFVDSGNAADYQTLFSLTHYKFDVGSGIRWYIDAFGFYPVIFRVDVAIPIDSPVKAESRPHYYLGAGHAF